MFDISHLPRHLNGCHVICLCVSHRICTCENRLLQLESRHFTQGLFPSSYDVLYWFVDIQFRWNSFDFLCVLKTKLFWWRCKCVVLCKRFTTYFVYNFTLLCFTEPSMSIIKTKTTLYQPPTVLIFVFSQKSQKEFNMQNLQHWTRNKERYWVTFR